MMSRPLSSGMTTSSKITSGFSARFWKIASRAVPASPTGSTSSSASSTSRSPDRTTAWSSTIRTRIDTLPFHLGADPIAAEAGLCPVRGTLRWSREAAKTVAGS
jgi:hypothetical protein